MTLPDELLDPAAYDFSVAAVEHLETHISHLFFAGESVFKVKKAVDLGFLDFTSLEQRRHFCHEEVRLNQRLAGDIYLGVVAIRRSQGRLLVGGRSTEGVVVDYAVKMRRLPADRMLDRLLETADIDNEKMRELATVLTRFHGAAATGEGVDEHGSLASVRANCQENFEQTLPFTRGAGSDDERYLVSPKLHAFLENRALAFLDDHADRFERRVAVHRIRDGHGDLHAGNICLLPDRIVIYDCIEFAARFRCGDVAADLAFLLMDLDRRRFRAFAAYLLHEYVSLSGDTQLAELVDFYKGYRAIVRAKVESMQLAGLHGEARAEARARAMGYYHLAASYELPRALILCCGLPGSGKSYAAIRLARPLDAVVLNSDRIRKRQAGMAPTERDTGGIGAGLYDAARSAETYAELQRLADSHLGKGRMVVVDAGFRTRQERRPFLGLADDHRVPCIVLHAAPPEDVVLARLAAREADSREVSDAGVDVYRALAAEFEPPDEMPAKCVVSYDGSFPIADLTGQMIDALIDAPLNASHAGR